jgi:hypothetical protein
LSFFVLMVRGPWRRRRLLLVGHQFLGNVECIVPEPGDGVRFPARFRVCRVCFMRVGVCVSCVCVCVSCVLDGIGDPQRVLGAAVRCTLLTGGGARGTQSAAAALSALAHALAETGSLAIVRYVKRNKGNPYLGCLSPRTSRHATRRTTHL